MEEKMEKAEDERVIIEKVPHKDLHLHQIPQKNCST